MKAWYVFVRDWFLYDLKLNKKIILIYFICTFIPFMLLSCLTSSAASEQVGEQSVGYMCSIIDQSCSFINYRLEHIIDKVDSIYLDSTLYDYLSSADGKGSPQYIRLLEAKLTSMTDTGEISAVSLYLNKLPSVPGSSHCHPMSSMYGTVWYDKMTDATSKSGTWIYSDDNKCFYYVKKMYSKYDSTELIGYVTAAIPQAVIKDSLDKICYADSSTAYILDAKSQPILSVSHADNSDFADEDIADLHLDEQISGVKIKNGKYFAVYRSLSNYSLSNMPQWKILMLTPWEVIFGRSEALLRTVIAASLVSIAVLILIVSWLIKGITRRIDRFNECMKNVRMGAAVECAVPVGRDEISSLQSNFNYMVVRMNNMFNQSIEIEEKARQSELSMLQSQINPHFLYNTLDVIKWEANKAGCTDIEETIYLLSQYYRMSLREGVSLVSLDEELKHIRLYAQLQNKRFEGKINLEINIPPEHRKCACLKLMLQPIVENSIIHGIMEKREPIGTVALSSELDGSDILIKIRDDGCGMPAEKIAALNNMCFLRPASGFGIYNTRQRVMHCFGSGYGINYSSNEDNGITVTIRIPFIEYKDTMINEKTLRNNTGDKKECTNTE